MKLLLLVQNESDVAHLEAAARAVLNSSITGVWVVFSPSITVDASDAAAKLDAEIGQLKTAERQAADRSDYAAAAGYKTQREGKELDRAKALRDAWKTAPAEARQAKTKAIFGPFLAQLQPNGISVKVSGHSDHYDREQWVAMLNSLSGVWFKEFAPGGFIVTWPESVTASVKPTLSPANLEKARERRAAEADIAAQKSSTSQTRREELEALHPMKLGPLMRSMDLAHEGLSRAQKIEAILAAEQKPASPTPELAEY